MGSPVCPLVRSPHSGGTSVKLKETIPGGVGRGWAGAGVWSPSLAGLLPSGAAPEQGARPTGAVQLQGKEPEP